MNICGKRSVEYKPYWCILRLDYLVSSFSCKMSSELELCEETNFNVYLKGTIFINGRVSDPFSLILLPELNDDPVQGKLKQLCMFFCPFQRSSRGYKPRRLTLFLWLIVSNSWCRPWSNYRGVIRILYLRHSQSEYFI